MNSRIATLATVVLLSVACRKEDPKPPVAPMNVTQWALRVIPRNDGAMTLTVNGDTVQILHDASFPDPGDLPGAYRPPVEVYYPVPTQVRRGDVVRFSTEGVHELLIGPNRVAIVDTGRITITVYP
jgi:hypothetical protein